MCRNCRERVRDHDVLWIPISQPLSERSIELFFVHATLLRRLECIKIDVLPSRWYDIGVHDPTWLEVCAFVDHVCHRVLGIMEGAWKPCSRDWARPHVEAALLAVLIWLRDSLNQLGHRLVQPKEFFPANRGVIVLDLAIDLCLNALVRRGCCAQSRCKSTANSCTLARKALCRPNSDAPPSVTSGNRISHQQVRAINAVFGHCTSESFDTFRVLDCVHVRCRTCRLLACRSI